MWFRCHDGKLRSSDVHQNALIVRVTVQVAIISWRNEEQVYEPQLPQCYQLTTLKAMTYVLLCDNFHFLFTRSPLQLLTGASSLLSAVSPVVVLTPLRLVVWVLRIWCTLALRCVVLCWNSLLRNCVLLLLLPAFFNHFRVLASSFLRFRGHTQ
jgi:hypothetical protein